MMMALRLLGSLGLILGLAACGEPSGVPISSAPGPSATNSQTVAAKNASTNQIRRFEVRGVVQQVKPADKTVVIKHEMVTNYMPAMTMPFEVKNTNELAHLRPGDQVNFTLAVTEDEGWAENIRKNGTNDPSSVTGTNAAPEHQSVRIVRDVDPLNIGDVMPDYSFTNQLGKKISLSEFKGQALAFTFIFTRCPFPNFCPRMGKNFEQAYQTLKETADAPTNWHLISISFDPEFDTPARLKQYSEAYNPDPQKWDFATGAMIDIDAITEQFGLYFAYDKGNFDHNLRTVVIDATGKVQQIFIGNEWKPEELVGELIKAAKAK